MAHVEIYKLKKTVAPEVKGYGMFEFFGMADGPLPQNYVKEFAGELSHGMLSDILGRTLVDPPEGYRGGPLEKGDIVVVDGEAYFLDRESDYKFAAISFDTSAIKDAVHVEYGRYVDYGDAAKIQRSFAFAYEGLDIPIGYEGEPGRHGSSKGISDFNPSPDNEYSPCYLHPQFLKGEDARKFVSLLHELWYAGRGKEIMEYLRENYPVTMKDLDAARSQFAPELLLPEVLRPLYKHIPADADKTELAYLAAKVEGLDDEQRGVFYAVTHIGWQCRNVAEIINLTETLDCFELRPALNENMYGHYRLEQDWDDCEPTVSRLEKSEDPAEQALAKHIRLLNRAVDEEAYGYHAAKSEGLVFTPYGLLSDEGSGEPRAVYRGIQDIPAEFLAALPTPETAKGDDEYDIAEAKKMVIHYASLVHDAANGIAKPSVLSEISEAREAARGKGFEPREKTTPAPGKKKSDPDL